VTSPRVGVLLTGGASRRLGTDKALVRSGPETLAARSARVLLAVCPHSVEVGPGHTTLPVVREARPGQGPLAALAAAADATAAGSVLLLATDLPRVEVPLLRLLADWPGDATVVPVRAGVPQPVCARYGDAALARARVAVERGERSLRALLDDAAVVYVDEDVWGSVAPESVFDDVDTVDDLARLGLQPPG
jgi:molybdopterin-guanine dinucleotide biosynthesis protein A